VPAGLPDETQDSESDQIDWRFYHSETISGSTQNVTVSNIVFNFDSANLFKDNNSVAKSTSSIHLFQISTGSST
jgi:hypothetical protein